jgi:hypothetical protein
MLNIVGMINTGAIIDTDIFKIFTANSATVYHWTIWADIAVTKV